MKNKVLKTFSYSSKILVFIMFIFFVMVIASIYKVNVFPMKYIITFILIAIIILGLFCFLIRKDKPWLKIFVSIFSLINCLISLFVVLLLNKTFNFLGNLGVNEFEGINYNLIVLKDSNFNNVSDLSNETIGMLEENSNNVIEELSDKVKFNDSIVNNAGSLLEGLYHSTYSAIVVDNDVLALLKEDEGENKFDDIAHVIFTFNVKTKVSDNKGKIIKIEDKPFAIYISGIDQYGAINTVRGRSDVNIIALVNPKTYKILLINTPRDYYVQLHDKIGLKDKLTHAGVYGIDLSVSTLEDLYDLNIDYYLRINFDTLIQVVDVIGGIEVYSDTTFNSSHIPGWIVEKGMVHLDGKHALAYSRERYAYLTGDRHRGQNQQDVINAIIKKASKSKVILTKYSDILDSLSDSFQTNMPIETIQSFIKFQLDKLPTWDVENINVSGSDAYEYTYSYGERQKLYVMVPYESDIIDAKNKINGVISGK